MDHSGESAQMSALQLAEAYMFTPSDPRCQVLPRAMPAPANQEVPVQHCIESFEEIEERKVTDDITSLAMTHTCAYLQCTIHVSGYSVTFYNLRRKPENVSPAASI